MLKKTFQEVKEKTPLVHCITNYVTVNDCANSLLACGGSPIMADDIGEVEEIISICNSLCINIGTLNERSILSMLAAGKRANELSYPVVLDPVGAGASTLRTATAFKLIKQVKFSVIRGNISEIKTVAQGAGTTKGVDADASDAVTGENLEDTIAFAKKLSEKTQSVIAITGAIDIVADSHKAYVISNGNALMSKVSGTGCMLSAIIAAFCGANPTAILDATAAAVCFMGLCGELAFDRLALMGGGTSTYRTLLIDFMSQVSPDILEGGAKIETR
ncbi:hydroxyethylthiazole kinase [Acetobacterium bakii]|uniref:Hydroxyethylthiazole kinase n=1 Tax=Acetobacterium bakii TaxID=52689 RepID=A0A0L6U4F3_9FIRM|nr:hydroxyethylthiazole kinase [Acetobacterium bakii]KNZ43373.1 hydroxyethylthiazole kinase [Acetobacterium bakii]